MSGRGLRKLPVKAHAYFLQRAVVRQTDTPTCTCLRDQSNLVCLVSFLFYFYVVSDFILFYFVLFCFILFYFILFYFILFYFIYFILFYFILFYFISLHFIFFFVSFVHPFSFLFFLFQVTLREFLIALLRTLDLEQLDERWTESRIEKWK